MDTKNTPSILAVRTSLFPVIRAIATVSDPSLAPPKDILQLFLYPLDRQILLLKPLPGMHCRDWLL